MLKFLCLSLSKLNSTYLEEINWLFQQFPSYQKIGSKAYKPTLENILSITESIGSPQDTLNFVHVAGSNGKGSTCSMLASILTEAGYKVGLFTSPHIKDFTERIRINGECIPKSSVVNFIHQIKKEPYIFSPSFFEVTFALALDHFKKNECDICIIETGLGGRLDATNIISPLLSVITNISLEHTAILGETLEEIAIEKAGIIKNNIPVVLGQMSKELTDQFKSVADTKKSVVFPLLINTDQFDIPLLGEYQKDNFQLVSTVISALKESNFSATDKQIQNGLNNLNKNTGFSGRLQVVENDPTVIFDVSHNEAGIEATLKEINKINRGALHIVFGSSNDKDIRSIIKLFPNNARCYFTEFSNDRSCSTQQLSEALIHSDLEKKMFFNDANKALKEAKSTANQNDTILVIGSFFLVSDFFLTFS